MLNLFSIGASIRGGSTSALAAELNAQVRPLPIISANASLQVTTQGDTSATLEADTGLPGLMQVGGGFNFRGLELDNSFLFGRISPLEFFTLQSRVFLQGGRANFLFSGAINPLGFISDAFSLGTTIEINPQNLQPTVRIVGRLGGIDFVYTDGAKPDINVGISIVLKA
ncbi:MAG: hypothetical protein CV045_03925 [Cyanobacteria bacterium M5B4]|nr:hypothetical protein [Cyanobacteria bacterium KgW148]PLS69138.1 MAG: hypothetical protein CV045_03925 [Cyanobacteria bacterium M5B4]